jgi:aminoglycoside phosphotransferase
LCNRKSQTENRRTPFNLNAFCRAACLATGASAVQQMTKIAESFNRVLLLKFDNGTEAVALFPTQMAGPPHFTTASEVATMEFLRHRLGLPVPRVLAYDADASMHEVGAEFIIMEKVAGIPLWRSWIATPPGIKRDTA